MRPLPLILLCLSAALLAGCATATRSTVDTEPLDREAKWALLPVANNTDTPQAGLAAEAMLEHHLLGRGIGNLVHYPAAMSRDSLFEPTERKVSEEAQKWAHDQGVRFALTGSVEEWRYKVGLDGEPVVGITLKVVDLKTGRTVWSASGAQSGWSRNSLASVAQALISDLLRSMKLAGSASPS
jgi:polysaccharide biosynthesis protein PelC